MMLTRRCFLAALVPLAVVGLGCGGCGGRKAKYAARQNGATAPTPSPFMMTDPEFELAVIIDRSGSFSEFFKEDGRAYKLILKLIDRYYRDRTGHNDRLLISEISGAKLPVVWEGPPKLFRQKFGPKSFSEMVRSRPDPGGSRVHDSIADTLEYLMGRRKLGTKTQSAVVCFSDMEDNFPNSAATELRLADAIKRYHATGGWIGFAFVRQDLCPRWAQHLRDAGYQDVFVGASNEELIDSIRFGR